MNPFQKKENEQKKIDAAGDKNVDALKKDGVAVAQGGAAGGDLSGTATGNTEVGDATVKNLSIDPNAEVTKTDDGAIKEQIKSDGDDVIENDPNASTGTDDAPVADATVVVHQTKKHSGGSEQIIDVKHQAVS